MRTRLRPNARRLTPVLLLLFTALLTGCRSFGDRVGDVFAQTESVYITVEDERGELVDYMVRSSTSKASQLGLKELRLGYWAEAADYLRMAVNEDPQDERSIFALGLAYEMAGELEASLIQYETVARIPRDNNPDYMGSVHRVRAKLGR